MFQRSQAFSFSEIWLKSVPNEITCFARLTYISSSCVGWYGRHRTWLEDAK